VIVAVPLCPSLVAVMVADPAATPVTSPLPSTVATAVLLLDQLMIRPVNGAPAALSGAAVSWEVFPAVMLALGGVTVTDATGSALTSTTDESWAPPALARARTLYLPGCGGAL